MKRDNLIKEWPGAPTQCGKLSRCVFERWPKTGFLPLKESRILRAETGG